MGIKFNIKLVYNSKRFLFNVLYICLFTIDLDMFEFVTCIYYFELNSDFYRKFFYEITILLPLFWPKKYCLNEILQKLLKIRYYSLNIWPMSFFWIDYKLWSFSLIVPIFWSKFFKKNPKYTERFFYSKSDIWVFF